ncbi:twin-arginine translocase TatA/TatE family subunit [Paenibacillus motobuensis]|uniref:Twin-arginine translocase TatA/TatE family subunit n=1 Tax=Paenibacillus lutimineralis TaxID=2707005 RepID=A0A3S9UUU9_9BACL|nr:MULTISPECIES: twin-arginine translocase TatA/TatE family subunit [Paenibacillus]AZS14074.1 twin-arginine translocase TatA/TatE family subunit [Paenibacillus lutimineralis]MCM3042864.1 twin-arginine translocase TatA/TatE family subunit [Paenibacillus lutimineralis]MCM3649968.1 twin-arginine translocase TatA/TatE family subunit [Paenibacillus motobuensis]NWL89907.1 twin-arginine translocase TatA/TatE family subunit [Paenibacillus sp. 79R4]
MIENLLRPSHLLLLVIAALLLFGPSKLPELGRSFGTMLKEFRKGARGDFIEETPQEVKPVQESNKS